MAVFPIPELRFPDGLGGAEFIRRYWQKKPLPMPGAFSGWVNPLDGDELAWLAGEDGVEARLVQGPDFRVRHGPFEARDFDALGASCWTLLVQDVDKHLPTLGRILDRFDFLPAWRLDDLMISFAAPGGSVGPHVDAYDVFLLQTQGQRRWEIGSAAAAGVPGSNPELELLAGFEPAWSGTLGPGDMLYLPPGVPHHGVALDAAMTWSIGFRAPSVADMAADFAAFVAAELAPALRYTDADLDPAEAAHGGLSDAAVDRARGLLTAALAADQETVRRWLGCLVTEGKPWLEAAAPDQILDAPALSAGLTAGRVLVRHPMSRWTHAASAASHLLFVDGGVQTVPPLLRDLVVRLCTRRRLAAPDLAPWMGDPEALDLLVRLHAAGKLYFTDS